MRIRRQLGVLREGQVVAVERGAVGQVTRTQKRRRRRVRDDLVALGELEITDLAETPASGVLRRCGAYATGLPDCDTHSVCSITS